MKVSYILIFTFISLISCNKEKENIVSVTISEFPKRGDLVSTVITIPPVALSPTNIFIANDKLIMFTMKKDTIFDIFSLPECKYKFSSGMKGEGPDDFLDIDRRLFIPTENGFKTFFQSQKTLKETIISDRIKINHDKDIKLDIEQYPINGFTPINDTLYLYWSGFDSKTEYNLYSSKSNTTTSFSPYPEWTSMQLKEDKIFTYVKNTTVRPDGHEFASFYGYFKKIRIYNADGKLMKDISLEIAPFDNDFSSTDRKIYYFAYPKSSEEYIYALCRNTTKNTISNPELQIWKWDGTPIGVYSLDKPISMFAVSEKYGKIYAVDGEKEDEIYVYDLPHI